MDYMDFRKRLTNDAAFRAKFDDCETLEALVDAAGRAGYAFTAEEVRNNTDVLPEELSSVVGGLNVADALGIMTRIFSWG